MCWRTGWVGGAVAGAWTGRAGGRVQGSANKTQNKMLVTLVCKRLCHFGYFQFILSMGLVRSRRLCVSQLWPRTRYISNFETAQDASSRRLMARLLMMFILIPISPPRVDSSKGPHRVNRAHWPTKENRQFLFSFVIFSVHGKNGLGWPQMGPSKLFSY